MALSPPKTSDKTHSDWMLSCSVKYSSSLLSFEVPLKCYRFWDRPLGEKPVVLQHWRCYSWSLFLGLLWCFGWSGLQTMPLETVLRQDCDSAGCCSSLGAAWGFHIRLDARLVPSALHCTCNVGRAQCVYRNNPHVLWTDWKQAPAHSIGTGPAAENTQSSAREQSHTSTVVLHNIPSEMVKGKIWLVGQGRKVIFRNTWWTSMWFFSIFKPHLHGIWKWKWIHFNMTATNAVSAWHCFLISHPLCGGTESSCERLTDLCSHRHTFPILCWPSKSS